MEAGVLQTVQSTCAHLILLPFCHGVIASQAQTGQTWPQFVSEHSGPSLDRFSDVKSKVRLSVPTGLVSVRKQIWREVKKHTHKHTTKDKTAQPTGAKLTFFIYFYFSFCCYSGQGKKKKCWMERGRRGRRFGESGREGWNKERGVGGEEESLERNRAELLSDTGDAAHRQICWYSSYVIEHICRKQQERFHCCLNYG